MRPAGAPADSGSRIHEDRDSRLLTLVRLELFAGVLLSPLPFGAVTRTGVAAVELWATLLCALVLVALFRDRASIPPRTKWAAAPFALLICVLLLQLTAFPASVAKLISPTLAEFRTQAGEMLGRPQLAWIPISYSLPDTFDAACRWIAYGMIGFSAAVTLRRPGHLRTAMLVVCLSASFQALYGAVEYLSGHHHIFGYAKKHYLDSATGTFINRNHFASYLAMGLPSAAAYWMIPSGDRQRRDGWRNVLLGFARPERVGYLFALASAIVIVAGIFLSYSRGGLLAALLGCGLLATSRLVRRRRLLWVAAVFLVPALYLSWQELRPPGDRFLSPTQEYETLHGRVPVWRAAMAMTRDTSLLGTGFGTFEDAFRLYQPPDIRLRFDHAHNDWLQAWVEGGPLAVLLLAGLLWVLLFGDDGMSPLSLDSVRATAGAGCGLLAVSFHSLFDFPLKIPAVAVLAAVYAGILAGNHTPWATAGRWNVERQRRGLRR